MKRNGGKRAHINNGSSLAPANQFNYWCSRFMVVLVAQQVIGFVCLFIVLYNGGETISHFFGHAQVQDLKANSLIRVGDDKTIELSLPEKVSETSPGKELVTDVFPMTQPEDPETRNESFMEIYSGFNCTGSVLKVPYSHKEKLCSNCFDVCEKSFEGHDMDLSKQRDMSVRVVGSHSLDIYLSCKGTWTYTADSYHSTITSQDGCVDGIGKLSLKHFQFQDSSTIVQASESLKSNNSPVKSYNVVFSAESSFYMSWQSLVNKHAFEKTQPQSKAAWTRLMSCQGLDDLAETLPTIAGKRNPQSKMYGPVNKPDIIDKWMNSEYKPKEEVIVVIDPDNFLLNDLSPIVEKVSRGNPIAQSAWYRGQRSVDDLWKVVCEKNCDFKTDHSAVPIFIHREDLAAIAPLWRYYTMKVKLMHDRKDERLDRFRGNQIVDWSSEMMGYVFASAHLGIRHTIDSKLQIRDVDSRYELERMSKIPMLHAGRAWFPENYEPGKKWWNTEGKDLARQMKLGEQVWCKCNYTAYDEVAWPIPEGTDYVSRQTLTLIHETKEKYPTLPQTDFRKKASSMGAYHWSHN